MKHYTDKLFYNSDSSDEDDESPNSQSSSLEYIVNLFLTVRGFAAARLERSTLRNIKITVSNKGESSFRESLKEKYVNVKQMNTPSGILHVLLQQMHLNEIWTVWYIILSPNKTYNIDCKCTNYTYNLFYMYM